MNILSRLALSYSSTGQAVILWFFWHALNVMEITSLCVRPEGFSGIQNKSSHSHYLLWLLWIGFIIQQPFHKISVFNWNERAGMETSYDGSWTRCTKKILILMPRVFIMCHIKILSYWYISRLRHSHAAMMLIEGMKLGIAQQLFVLTAILFVWKMKLSKLHKELRILWYFDEFW